MENRHFSFLGFRSKRCVKVILYSNHIAIGAVALGFDSRPIESYTVSPLLRRFFGAVLLGVKAAEIDPATRYTLRRNTASIMKIEFFFF